MTLKRIGIAGLLVAAGIGLSACASDGYYGGMYGGGGYYSDAYYSQPYYGWYDDYYYPGTGYYVYDSNRRPHRWDSRQRAYWQHRGQNYHGDRHDNWDRWDHRSDHRGDRDHDHDRGDYHHRRH